MVSHFVEHVSWRRGEASSCLHQLVGFFVLDPTKGFDCEAEEVSLHGSHFSEVFYQFWVRTCHSDQQ